MLDTRERARGKGAGGKGKAEGRRERAVDGRDMMVGKEGHLGEFTGGRRCTGGWE